LAGIAVQSCFAQPPALLPVPIRSVEPASLVSGGTAARPDIYSGWGLGWATDQGTMVTWWLDTSGLRGRRVSIWAAPRFSPYSINTAVRVSMQALTPNWRSVEAETTRVPAEPVFRGIVSEGNTMLRYLVSVDTKALPAGSYRFAFDFLARLED